MSLLFGAAEGVGWQSLLVIPKGGGICHGVGSRYRYLQAFRCSHVCKMPWRLLQKTPWAGAPGRHAGLPGAGIWQWSKRRGGGRGEREREARSSPKHCENRLASPQHLAIYGLAACFQGDGCEGMMRGGRGLQECCSGAAPGCWSPAGPAPCPHCRAALGQRGWAPGGESPEQCCCRPHKRPHSASGVRGVPTWPGGDAGSPQGCFKAQHRRQAPSCQCVQEGMLSA